MNGSVSSCEFVKGLVPKFARFTPSDFLSVDFMESKALSLVLIKLPNLLPADDLRLLLLLMPLASSSESLFC